MDSKGQLAHSLCPDEAADLLGVSARTVRRMIARGELEGSQAPYSTTVYAVDALRRRQQRAGDLYNPPLRDNGPPRRDIVHSVDNAAGVVDTDDGTGLMVAIAAELASARDQIERLARENGRLQACLEQARAAPSLSGPATPQTMPQASRRAGPASEAQPAVPSAACRAQESAMGLGRRPASERQRTMLGRTLARLGRWLLR